MISAVDIIGRPEGGAAGVLEAVQNLLGRAAVNGDAGEIRPEPGRRPVDEETFGLPKTFLAVRPEPRETLDQQHADRPLHTAPPGRTAWRPG